MTQLADHPALVPNGAWLVCADARCATVLALDDEICDECGGTRLDQLYGTSALLCGWADERPVAFRLSADRPLLIGRSTSGGRAPDIDLRRFPGNSSVHRRHAWLEARGRGWHVTHLGTNPLVVGGRERVALEPGGEATAHGGDTLEVGAVHLLLVAPALAKRI